MPHVLTFGEILLRLQGSSEQLLVPGANDLKIYPGGSEANVAVTLAKMGNPVYYSSAFPNNGLAKELIHVLESSGVDCSKHIQSGDRIGLYFLLSANGLTSGEVIYDRKYSSFSLLKAEELDFDTLFADVDWFHWSALTPALSAEMAELMALVLQEAKQRDITVSVDLNYRSKLWQYGRTPLEVMPELVQHCDVIMGNIWAAHNMLGSPIEENLDKHTERAHYLHLSQQTADYIFSHYPQAKHIANTFRFIDNPKHNLFYGTYHSREEQAISQQYETHEVVDRIGSGDAFMGGLIHALRQPWGASEIIEYATATGYQKLFVEGDFGDGKAL